jgi:hypothetical protein
VQDAAEAGDHVVRGPSRGLIDDENRIQEDWLIGKVSNLVI